jgi:hypothetical protein
MRGAVPALPNTPSRRGAQLKHRDNENDEEHVERNRGSLVSIATNLRAGRPVFDFRKGLGIFSLPPRPVRLCGPPSLLFNWFRV